MKIEEEKKKLGLLDSGLDREGIIENARRRFKTSPKAGLDYLREMSFFPERGTPQEVAKFFFEVCLSLPACCCDCCLCCCDCCLCVAVTDACVLL